MPSKSSFILPSLCAAAMLLSSCATNKPATGWQNAVAPKASSWSKTLSLLNKDGAPSYCILIAKDASAQEKFAANELKARLDSFGHGEFAIVTDDTAQKGPELRVGKTARSSAILPNVGFDGISIRACSDGSIELLGGEHRGLVNAVYAFLEEDLGYRYWGPNAERIPETLCFKPVTRSYTPALEWREPFMSQSFKTIFSLRNRTDSPDAKVPEDSGGHYWSLGYVHTMVYTIPPAQHFKEHPDWFMMEKNGKRISYNQWCETNQELAQYLIDYYLKKIEKEKVIPNVIGITKRDGGGVCHCPNCEKVNTEEESEAGSLLTLINRVAAGIGAKYPQIRILTFAYLETEKRPKNIKPASNVIMMYCNTKNSWSHVFVPAREDANVCSDVIKWGEVAPLVIWDYSTNFDHYCIPLPNIAVIADNIKFWVENNAKGVMTQGAYQSLGSERDVMRAWIISKLLWNPYYDHEKLMEDFILAYFGKASAPILEYNRMLEEIRVKHAEEAAKLNIRYGASAFFLTDDFIAKSKELYRQAHELAGDDKVLNERIDRDELSILYTDLLKQISSGIAKPDFNATHDRFAAIAKKVECNFIGEKKLGALDDFLKSRPVNQSEEQITFQEDDKATVVRLDATWKLKKISDSNSVIADASKFMEENVDTKDWIDCKANGKTGWKAVVKEAPGTGVYRKSLRFAPAKQRKFWYLVAPGIDEEGWITINGTQVAEKSAASTGLAPIELWNYPVVADITQQLRLGFAENTIAIKTFNTEGLGGLYSGVFLIGSDEELTPKQAIDLLPELPVYGISDAFKK